MSFMRSGENVVTLGDKSITREEENWFALHPLDILLAGL